MADKLTYGSFYFSTPVETVLSATTPAKALGTTTEGSVKNGFTMSANNRLELDAGQTTRDYHILATISSTKASGGSTNGSFYIAKNGTVITSSVIKRTLSNTADIGAMAICSSVSLAAGDYVELWVETDNGDNLTIEAGGLVAKVLG